MSVYDGMEAMFLQPSRISACRVGLQLHRHTTSFTVSTWNIARYWGQFQVWALLFLLASPSSCNPLHPSHQYLQQNPHNSNQQQKSASSRLSTVQANEQEDQLTTEQVLPYLKRQNLFSQHFAHSLSQGSGGNSLSYSDPSSLSILSDSLKLEYSPVVVKKVASVYNAHFNNKIISFINKHQENNLAETRNEIDDSVSLEAIKDGNKYSKSSAIRSSNSRNRSKSLNTKRRTSLDTKSFKIPIKSIAAGVKPTSVLGESVVRASSPSSLPVSKSSSVFPTDSSGDSIVSTVVSRVQRHTAEPTRLESLTFESTLVEDAGVSASAASTMDMTDNARQGRGSNGGGSGGSRINTAHWSLPCRIDMATNPLSSPSYLSGHIYNNVNVAHKHAHRFKDSFSSQMWDGMDWESAITMVADDPFEFLNRLNIPNDEQLKTLEFNDVLRIAYESMQRRAVSIEQVTLDQALYRDLNDTDFLSEFRTIEGEIVSILCELHYAMIQQGVTPSETITAEIMKEKYRDVDSSSGRLTRDTIILREYLNGLDYLMVVFGYFKSQAT